MLPPGNHCALFLNEPATPPVGLNLIARFHDWWNASTRDARVRVEITPGERFVHMIETFYGLARLGHTDRKGMPYPLQLALSAQEFSDVIVFRRWRCNARSLPHSHRSRAGAAIARRTRSSRALCWRLGRSSEGRKSGKGDFECSHSPSYSMLLPWQQTPPLDRVPR
jgi:hypothetical protein